MEDRHLSIATRVFAHPFRCMIYIITLLAGFRGVPASLGLNIAVAIFFALPAHGMGKP